MPLRNLIIAYGKGFYLKSRKDVFETRGTLQSWIYSTEEASTPGNISHDINDRQRKSLHNIARTLVKPCAKEMAMLMCGKRVKLSLCRLHAMETYGGVEV
jgi:hypothetical protein